MRKYPMIYIAGPYRAPDEYTVFANIMRARDAAVLVWRLGYIPITPHLLTFLMNGVLEDDEEFLARELQIVRMCDALLLLRGWESSKGTADEKAEAEKLQLPVFSGVTDLLRRGRHIFPWTEEGGDQNASSS